MATELTQPKLRITIDMPSVLKRWPRNDDARKSVFAAIRSWCDFAEKHGSLSSNVIDSEGRIIGKANYPRARHRFTDK